MKEKEDKEFACEAANFDNKPFITNDLEIIGMRLKKDVLKEIREKAEKFQKNCLHYSDVYSEIESKIKYLLNKGVTEEEIREFIDQSFKKILSKKNNK